MPHPRGWNSKPKLGWLVTHVRGGAFNDTENRYSLVNTLLQFYCPCDGSKLKQNFAKYTNPL